MNAADSDLTRVSRPEAPLVLRVLHRGLPVDAVVSLLVRVDPDDGNGGEPADACRWPGDLLGVVLSVAGFAVEATESVRDDGGDDVRGDVGGDVRRILVRRVDGWGACVGPGMRTLMVGLNPSPSSAVAGVGFVHPSNRFWPAMLEAGLTEVTRDPEHLLAAHRIGMCDFVTRPTRRADEVTAGEYRAGFARLEALVGWLQPERVAIIGLHGWRLAVDRTARLGWQPVNVAGRPAYIMPNPSGLNAHTSVADIADHLRRGVLGPMPTGTGGGGLSV